MPLGIVEEREAAHKKRNGGVVRGCGDRQLRSTPHFDSEYNCGYTFVVKTAISVPDDVFDEAEEFAANHGVSRSELYVTALRGYLQQSRNERVTEKLNAVYGDESKDQYLERAAQRLLRASRD